MPEPTPIFASLTRISDLSSRPFGVSRTPRVQWATGDYVVGEVVAASRNSPIELATGRTTEVCVGDLVVGALGVRSATLEAVGDWKQISDDGLMQALTAAGIFGRVTSISSFLADPIALHYRGHVVRNGRTVRMSDFVPPADRSPTPLTCPVVLLIGTSMSSGKTTSARVIIRRLRLMGLRVVGCKLTGAGRYRDVLAMSDSGADAVFDFVDQGLASTVCDPELYRPRLRNLLGRIAAVAPDIVVAEAGASPLEPYNGDTAMDELDGCVRCTVLCASDPYSVVGVTQGFGFQPDVVCGVAASTSAGVEVIKHLSGIEALNLLDRKSHPALDRLLCRTLGLNGLCR